MSEADRRETVLAGWRAGLAALVEVDPDLGRIVVEAGPPPIELREPGFPTLLRAIVAQQVSAAAARSIWAKVEERVRPLTPDGFLALAEEEIRALGFSRQKIAYACSLADEIASGRLDLEALARMPDEEAMVRLVQLKGIGRWSAEVYMLFALGRIDIWPALDLALAVAVQKIKRLDNRPTPKSMLTLADPWRPWRSVAAVLLWHYYRNAP